MSFFEPPPPPPERPPPRRHAPWVGPPENELGTAVATRVVLAQTEELAIAVIDLVAYSTGFAVRLALRIKPDGAEIDPHTLMTQLGRGGGRPVGAGGSLPYELLRFGVEFADGRRATTLDPRPRPGGERPEISLSEDGGGGGRGGFELRYWIHPLPPPGPLTFAVEWPARGIATTRVEVDAGPIVDAGSRSDILWEDDRPLGAGPGAAPGAGFGSVRFGSMRLERPEEPPSGEA